MNELVVEYGLWGLFGSAFISSTIAPGGSEAVLIYLLNESHFSPIDLLFVATFGNTLGALTTWLLGMLVGRGYPLGNLTEKKHQKALMIIRKWGVTALLFSWLPVIGDALCLAAGWLKFSFYPSLLMITVGKALRYGLLIYLFA